VGFFLGKDPSFPVVQQYVSNTWRKFGFEGLQGMMMVSTCLSLLLKQNDDGFTEVKSRKKNKGTNFGGIRLNKPKSKVIWQQKKGVSNPGLNTSNPFDVLNVDGDYMGESETQPKISFACRSLDIDSKQLANGSQSDKKKAKRRTSKTQEGDENTNINIEKENKKSSATKPGNKEKETELCIKKTLSNGLVIEDLKAGKVKVQYVVTLKENGKVIDSNGKSPYNVMAVAILSSIVIARRIVLATSVLKESVQDTSFLHIFSSVKRFVRYSVGFVAIRSLIVSFAELSNRILKPLRWKLMVIDVWTRERFEKAFSVSSHYALVCVEWIIRSIATTGMRVGDIIKLTIPPSMREEMRDEKKILDHLKQDQTMLVIKRFNERKKLFKERKKTGKIRAKRCVFLPEIVQYVLTEFLTASWWRSQRSQIYLGAFRPLRGAPLDYAHVFVFSWGMLYLVLDDSSTKFRCALSMLMIEDRPSHIKVSESAQDTDVGLGGS
nr:choline transporter protein 1-like [Tanacetum cinerariifolium]